MLKKYVLIIILLLQIIPVQAKESPAFNNLTILVSSCDKYSFLWDSFFKLLFQQWPSLTSTNQHVPILLISNKKSYVDPRVKNIQIYEEKSWSDNILTALKEVKTKYVLILLEDYFITNFNEARFKSIFDTMVADDVAYIQIACPAPHYVNGGLYPHLSGVHYKGRFDHFRTSLDACVWRTEDLERLLKPGENAWHFEGRGNLRSQGTKGHFLSVIDDVPLTYLNIVNRGYVVANNLEEAKQWGVDIQDHALPLAENYKFRLWAKVTLPQLLHQYILLPSKHFGEILFSKL